MRAPGMVLRTPAYPFATVDHRVNIVLNPVILRDDLIAEGQRPTTIGDMPQ